MSKGGSFVWSKTRHQFIPKAEFQRERAVEAVRSRSDLPCPMIISDNVELRSMADGKTYTSKRGYEASIRAQGLEIVGNSPPSSYVSQPQTDKQHEADIAADVKTAIEQVAAGYHLKTGEYHGA